MYKHDPSTNIEIGLGDSSWNVTIFSSEEEEDGQLDDNSETNEDGGTRTRGPKTPPLKWTNTLNCKELQNYENLSGPKHSLPVGSSEKDFFELFVTMIFSETVSTWKAN